MNLPAFPNLPTDNLYKFQTLASMIGAIVCLVIGLYLAATTELELNRIEAETNYIQFKTKIESGNDSIKQKARDARMMYDLSSKKNFRDSAVIQLQYYDEELRILDSAKRKLVQYVIDQKPIMVEGELATKARLRAYPIVIILFVLSTSLALLTMYHLRRWYNQHQKYQDLILKNQAEGKSE